MLAACFAVWSCNPTADDVYTVTFKLDSSRVGKFDSVRVQIYNGAAPGPGDTITPVQVEVIRVGATTAQVTVQLDPKVRKDFSVVITGYSDGDIAYRNLHTIDGFNPPDSAKPDVLLITRIDAEDLTLSVGETRAPDLAFTPSDAGDKRYVLASRDSDIVTVVGDSLIGVKAGEAKVIASTPDFAVSIDFTVNVADVRVTELKADSLFLKVGDTTEPQVTVLPENATDKGFDLESTDSTVLEVSGKSVTGLKAGNVGLILKSRDGGAEDTVAVEVRVPVTGLTGKDLVKELGEVFAPVLEWEPSDATHQEYTLESKDTNNVAVRGDSLEAKALGAAKVVATSRDEGFATEFEVKVEARVFHVESVEAADLRALTGDTLETELTWTPDNASDKGFLLSSSDSSVVVVADNKVVAKTLGKATLTVTTVDGAKTAEFEVSVELADFKTDIEPITSFKCAPCHVPPATFNWLDSNQLIRKGGIAVDRLTRPDTAVGRMPLAGAPNGNLTPRELNVMLGWLTRVAIPLQSVMVADTTVNLGDTVAPAIEFTPANASDKIHTLASEDTNVVVVRGEVLVPVNTGSADIDLTTDEGPFHAKFTVTVEPPLFTKNILPITSVKCFPCHGPGTTFNWQDSASLISDGTNALDRLQRDPDAPGRMPLKIGAPNGDLTPTELHVLLVWLNSKVVPLKGITVPDDSVPLGAKKAPDITFDPVGATNKTYELISSDTNTITIDGSEYFGKALGTTTVLVRTYEGSFSKSISVKVIPVRVDSIQVADSACAIGDTVVARVSFFPDNAANQGYTLSLPNASTIVKLDATAKKVIGLALGKDTLTATSTDGSKKAGFIFTVGPVLPKSLSIPDTNGTGTDLVTPRLIWTPATTTNKAYTLSIPPADTLVAAVRGNAILCKTVGTVAVVNATSTADPSVKATFKFTVGPVPVQSIQVAKTVAVLGSTFAPAITFTPANATDKSYTLTVQPANSANLTVSGASLIGKHLDSATVTVKTVDGAKTASWTVVVTRPPWSTAGVKTIVNTRCIQCHYPGNPSGLPNWQDSATVVKVAASPATDNPALIISRVSSTTSPMPPTYAQIPGPLSAADIKKVVDWLSLK